MGSKVTHDAFSDMLQNEQFQGHALEIGATSDQFCLLRLPCFQACCTRSAVNLKSYTDPNIRFICGNAHSMPYFQDASMSVVACTSMLEHDPKFWLTVHEINRIVHPGGTVIIGVPGFTHGPERCGRTTRVWPLHGVPHDYWRFSIDAVRTVLLAGMTVVSARTINEADRPFIIAIGRVNGGDGNE